MREPLEPYVGGYAEKLVRQVFAESAGQHVCFIAHLDRCMSVERVGVTHPHSDQLSDRIVVVATFGALRPHATGFII